MADWVKESCYNAGDARDVSSIPGSERSPREGNGNPLQYSCLENPMDRRAWGATVLRVARNQTGLNTQHYSISLFPSYNVLVEETGSFSLI